MRQRWLCSRWLWLAVCVVVGSLVFTVPALQGLQQAIQFADAFSSGIREGLHDSGFRGPQAESRLVSVSFLFGLVTIEDTAHPYLWSVIGGIVTGGGLGVIVWGATLAGMSAWRKRKQATAQHVNPATAPGPATKSRPDDS